MPIISTHVTHWCKQGYANSYGPKLIGVVKGESIEWTVADTSSRIHYCPICGEKLSTAVLDINDVLATLTGRVREPQQR